MMMALPTYVIIIFLGRNSYCEYSKCTFPLLMECETERYNDFIVFNFFIFQIASSPCDVSL